jgi:hypothetical protein
MIEKPANKFGVKEFTVKESFGVKYDSNEYIFAFHPSCVVDFVRVDESSILITFELFKIF